MESKTGPLKWRSGSTFVLVRLFLSLVLLGSCHGDSQNGTLAADEVRALSEIAKELGKSDWNFSLDPCTYDTSWRSERNLQQPTHVNQLICSNCSRGVCHVVNISLKGQDLAGVLPKSLAKLPYLKVIDLSRNYLAGSIPSEWASMSLEYMSLIVNRLSGRIPEYLGNMTTLTYLNIESNQFSGPVPAELGNLVNLQTLNLNGNYLNGTLPKALKNLSNLTELRISSNNFSGGIPDYFQSWTTLEQLQIQGSGFIGPIPTSISSLTNLFELRISDLEGESSQFPQLGNMGDLTYLMLRNCNISGSIPSYLSALSSLKSLDLSFNNLEGSIPDELQILKVAKMYLTMNFLHGSIPDWIKNKGENYEIDLSYNNFDESSVPSSCDNDNLNFFRSSSRKRKSPLAVCLANFPCSQVRYSLYINCGGNEATIGKVTYNMDNETGGAAFFVPTRAEWGFSNTGHFWFKNPTGDYIATNNSVLHVNDTELYTEARISAISLTYYGRCLGKGNYTVNLYFAEIIFRDKNSFYRLGRRIFDVYIQEKLVLKDFDIVKAAKGTDKVFKATFKNISVEDTGTVEIRFYYAGKGSTAVPARGVYGPLISAISVESEFSPPPNRKKVIDTVVGSATLLICLLLIACGVFIWRQREKNKPSKEEVLRGIDLQTGFFTYQQIKAATDNFDPTNKIGEGGFGSVFRGTLLDGTHIAVKQLSAKSSQGNKEFVTEIGMISSLQHQNVVRLYGCCVEGSQLFLVYEYMVNNNLARALFDENVPLRLDWPARMKICSDVAKGLAFLHEESAIRIVHRDIKATNVLLDENLNAKISDFGLARLRDEENTHISTKVAGTMGYMSPEYALWGYLTFKADVYSFGVVALEIVAGRSNMDFQPDENNFCLLDWAVVQNRKGDVMQIIDKRLRKEFDEEEAVRMIKIALLCTVASPALRPMMSEVVCMLNGSLCVRDSTLISDPYGWMPQSSTSQGDPTELESASESESFIHSSKAGFVSSL